MPADYTINIGLSFVLTRLWGVVTNDELLNHQSRLRADPDFPAQGLQLVDATDVDRLELDTETLKKVATNSPWAAGARRAVAIELPTGYGLARIFQFYAANSPEEVEVFTSLSEAEQWLGLKRH